MALAFTTGFKNSVLDSLTGKTPSVPYAIGQSTYGNIRVSTSGAAQLLPGAYGVTTYGSWSTVVAGTSTYSQSVTPNAAGVAANMEFIYGSGGTSVATGTVSYLGSGTGNILVPTSGALTFASGTPVVLTCVLKVPPNNGGTLKMNQALTTALGNSIINGTSYPSMAASGGVITFFNGTQPADADTAIGAQTVLGTYSFAAGTDFAAAAASSTNLSASKSITVTGTNTAQFFRWTKGAYTMDGTVGTTGADCIVDSTTFVSPTARSMTSLILSFP